MLKGSTDNPAGAALRTSQQRAPHRGSFPVFRASDAGLDVDQGYAAARHLYDHLGYRDVGYGSYLASASVEGGGVWMERLVFLLKELR